MVYEIYYADNVHSKVWWWTGWCLFLNWFFRRVKKKNRSRGSCLCSFARCQFRSTHPSRPHQSSPIFVLRFGSIFPNILVVFSCKYFGCIFANIFVLFFCKYLLFTHQKPPLCNFVCNPATLVYSIYKIIIDFSFYVADRKDFLYKIND